MATDLTNKQISIDDVSIKIEFPHTIVCEIDSLRRQVTVGRMELVLEGKREIPAGWRGKICMVSGIDRKITLCDWIVLPAMTSRNKTPIGPLLAEEISKDLITSQDEWMVEFYIADLQGKEGRLLRSPVKRREPSDIEKQIIEMKGDYESRLAEQEQELKDLRMDDIDRHRTERETQRKLNAYNEKIDLLEQELASAKKDLAKREEELAVRNGNFIETTNHLIELRNEFAQLQIDLSQAKKQITEQKAEIESLAEDHTNTTSELEKLRERAGLLENERDQKNRLAEDLKIEVERLQAELEKNRAIATQRNTKLDDEIAKARRLERELTENEKVRVEGQKIASDLKSKLQIAEAQLAERQRDFAELQEKSSQAIVDQDRMERETKRKVDAYVNQIEKLERQLEDLRIESEGLQAELEKNRAIATQRNTKLDDEIAKARRLERDLKKSEATQIKQAETIEQYEKTIEKLGNDHQEVEAEALRLRAERDVLKNQLSYHEATSQRLSEELTEVQSNLSSARSEVAKLQIKLRKSSAGQLLYDRYEVIRQLRSSDAGEIYKVCDKKLDSIRALRTLPIVLSSDRRALNDLKQEARLLDKLAHANTIRLYDFVAGDEPYIVMEHAEGRTFRQVIDTDAPLPLDQVIDYIEQICRGLAYAHNQQIYHRNLNPEHLILTDSGSVKIMDFGMAETIRVTMARITGKVPSEILRYLSPEQIRGQGTIDGRSDIYALGIVFYEMLSGQPPFTEDHVAEQHLNEQPQPIDHVPPKINSIVQKCLEKRPDERYSRVDELRKALKESL